MNRQHAAVGSRGISSYVLVVFVGVFIGTVAAFAFGKDRSVSYEGSWEIQRVVVVMILTGVFILAWIMATFGLRRHRGSGRLHNL